MTKIYQFRHPKRPSTNAGAFKDGTDTASQTFTADVADNSSEMLLSSEAADDSDSAGFAAETTDFESAALAAQIAEVKQTTMLARRAAAIGIAALLPIGLVAYDVATPKAAFARLTDSAISAAALLNGRSPGARSSQLLLTKTKRSLSASDGIGRRSRVISSGQEKDASGASRSIPGVVTPQTTTTSPELVGPLGDGIPAGGGVLGPGEAAPAGTAPASSVGPASLPGLFAPSVVDPGTETTPVITPPITSSAVPEPSTWLSMIFGMGLVGAGLRRKKAKSESHLSA